jgi:hypothetical protein
MSVNGIIKYAYLLICSLVNAVNNIITATINKPSIITFVNLDIYVLKVYIIYSRIAAKAKHSNIINILDDDNDGGETGITFFALSG